MHILTNFLEWTKWNNQTGCVQNESEECGKGTIIYSRNCVPDNRIYPNNDSLCNYPHEPNVFEEKCNLTCYGNFFTLFLLGFLLNMLNVKLLF